MTISLSLSVSLNAQYPFILDNLVFDVAQVTHAKKITTTKMNMIKKPDNVKRAKALFFAAAGISLMLSVSLWFTGHKEQGLYVGIWVPSICSAGSLILAGGRNG